MKQFAPKEKLDINLRLLRNKGDVFIKRGYYDLFISFATT